MGGVPSVGLWVGGGQRFGRSGGWQAVGQDFGTAAEGVAHLTTFLRLALSVSPSFFLV